MKKYLFIGLTILIGTNLAVLSGVAYNRMDEPTAQLTLTERELALPYNIGSQKENSGLSLSIHWRAPSKTSQYDGHNPYYTYNSRDIKISKDVLLALGFTPEDVLNNNWIESKELYWAFEFDGALHQAEIKKAEASYQRALSNYEKLPNKENNNQKQRSRKALNNEKTMNSRLFFIEAAAHYEALSSKYANKNNIVIVKGLAQPHFDERDKHYQLQLKHLSVRKIMVPSKFASHFDRLKSKHSTNSTAPRYTADVHWGKRLEPWIVDVKRLTP
ncbi:DUF4824 family protein [Flocculibacter collagenilyticus]|uniref:DUF4824 family protein n=1 Tax=Flocculibacter collagenilyticus TaxID=2744479 RepID=UPI0018F76546|nr:DUF4824 family protein [Flocculibacter collagenilyticus]